MAARQLKPVHVVFSCIVALVPSRTIRTYDQGNLSMTSTWTLLIIAAITSIAVFGTYTSLGSAQQQATTQQICDSCGIQIDSFSLHGGAAVANVSTGSSSFTFTLKNLGSATTYINSMNLYGVNGSFSTDRWSSNSSLRGFVNIRYWSCPALMTTTERSVSTVTFCSGSPLGAAPAGLSIPGESTKSFTFFPVIYGRSILVGQSYDFIVAFTNGQSVSGRVVAA
jgi:hypothetical protein